MTITMTRTEVRPETLQQRREALEDLAVRWNEMPAPVRNRKLKEVTALRGEDMWVAMTELRESMHDADAIDSGDLTWDQYYPELTGVICAGDRQHEALLIARSQVDDAMTVLLREPAEKVAA